MGVALTVLAGAVLLVWWVRTWRRVAAGPARGRTEGGHPPPGPDPVAADLGRLRRQSAPASPGSPACCASSPWPGPSARRRWPTPTTWPTPRPTCSTTSCWAGSSPPPSSRSSSTAWPTRASARRSSRSPPSSPSRSSSSLATTVAALVAAPYIIDALTALDTHAHPHQLHRVLLEREVATGFLRWFVIQIAAYGLFALGAALLNTRRKFVAVAWAPIVNNLVCIGILVWFGLWAGHGASLASVRGTPGPARPARPRHLARRGAPGRGARAEPAPRRPRAPALALEPPRRRAAGRHPPGRLDVRLRRGQPDRPLRRHRAGRQRRRARPGLVVHLRLRLLPAPLRHRRGHRHVGGHARPGRALVDRAADRPSCTA